MAGLPGLERTGQVIAVGQGLIDRVHHEVENLEGRRAKQKLVLAVENH